MLCCVLRSFTIQLLLRKPSTQKA
uniref:Uncharacterized protein n=1 Tax=Anguilla anguilla TaxID=7936 RepID=A0A0E9ST95_ANGAN